MKWLWRRQQRRGPSSALPWLLATLGCAASVQPSTPSRATPAAASNVTATVAAPSADDRLMAELIEARNAPSARRLSEDAQHLAELNADGVPCAWKAMLGSRAWVAFRLAGAAQPFAHLNGGVFAARLSNDASELFRVTSDNGGFVVQGLAQPGDISFYPAASSRERKHRRHW